MSDPIRIKQLDSKEGFKVFLVDAHKIRSTMDREFTTSGHHWSFKFIPESEIWIENTTKPSDISGMVDDTIDKANYCKAGMSPTDAHYKVRAKKQREETKHSQVRWPTKKPSTDFHKKRLESFGRVNIYLVDGDKVRKELDPDFTEGGHGRVYGYIPLDEIWIDDVTDDSERSFIILHELHEFNRMRAGLSYDEAHRESSTLERHVRDNPKTLDSVMANERRV
jgi:hypothetical protein